MADKSKSEDFTSKTEFCDIHGLDSILLNKFLQQREKGELCDVTLMVENKCLSAHSSLLAAFSDFFYKMFTAEDKEDQIIEFEITDVSAEIIETIINSLYTGQILLSEKTISDILNAATSMGITELLETAKTFLINNISSKNSLHFIDLVSRYSFEKILDDIYDFILQDFFKQESRDDFTNLKFKNLNIILPSNDLNVNEESSVFEFILKWTEKNIEARKKYFPELFKHVRLQFIPIKYVANDIRTNCFVNEFCRCKDVVEDTFSFYVTPNFADVQTARKSFSGKPDSLMLLSFESEDEFYFNLESKKIKKICFKGFDKNTVLSGCAMAEKFPVVILCGGIGEIERAVNQVVRFDGVRWMKMPEMNECRCGAAAVFYNDDVFVFGGEKVIVNRTSTYSHNQANPDANNFVKNYEKLNSLCWDVTLLPYGPRSYAAALLLHDIIYLIGGYCLSDPSKNKKWRSLLCKIPTSSTICYSPSTNTWNESAKMKYERAEFGSAIINENIIVVGGFGRNNAPINSVESFKAKNNEVWTLLQPSIPAEIVSCKPTDKTTMLTSKVTSLDGVTLYFMYNNSMCSFRDDPKSWNVLKTNSKNANLILPYAMRFHMNPII